jgi:hypothetical protein
MGATSAILTGVSAVGGFMAAGRQANAIDQKSDFDAKIAEMLSSDAIARGNTAAQRVGMQGRQMIGSQRVGLAAQGITLDSGSALDATTDTAKFSAMDEQMIRNNAAREAWGIRTNSTLSRLAARNESAAVRQQGVDTLITGAAKTYGIGKDVTWANSPGWKGITGHKG